MEGSIVARCDSHQTFLRDVPLPYIGRSLGGGLSGSLDESQPAIRSVDVFIP